MSKRYSIGRSRDCDLVLDNAFISRVHAFLEEREDGVWLIDNASANGTFLNSEQDRVVGERLLGSGDVVLVTAYHQVPADLLWKQVGQGGVMSSSGGQFEAGQEVIRIGRAPDNDIVLNSLRVSRYHAEIVQVSQGKRLIRDLSMRMGLWVNDQFVCGTEVPLHAGDRVEVAGTEVSVQFAEGQPGQTVVGTARQGFFVQARRVVLDVKDFKTGQPKRLLDDVSLTVQPGEFVGLMGPSGCGKTTLMTALNGCVPYTEGQVLYSGMDLRDNLGRLSPQVGYVPQDDIMHAELTVREVLYYSARLKSLGGTSDTEIYERAERVCRELNLTRQLDTPIGSETRKTLSGGQKKRVNLAIELMTDPKVLFLDEPTSGLSSKDTRDVMEILRGLADKGIAIVITIHQPSARVYRLMDKVIYLKAGKLCYFGPTYPDSITFFKGENCDPDLEGPDAVMEVLDERGEAQMEQTYWESSAYEEYVHRREEQMGQARKGIEVSAARTVRRVSPLAQFPKLCWRYLLCKLRDRAALGILLMQAPVIALLLGWTFRGQGLNAPLFMLVFVSLWFGVNNSARELVGELSIYRRERRSGLSPGAYFCSKFFGQAMLTFFQCGLLLGVSYPILELEGFFPMFLGVCWGCALSGVSIGLLVSAWSRSEVSAIVMVPLILIPFILFGGLLKPYEDMGNLSKGLGGLVPARWGYEAVVQVENDVRDYVVPNPALPVNEDSDEDPNEFVPFFLKEDLKSDNQNRDYRMKLLLRAVFCLGLFVWFPSLTAYLRLRAS